MTLERAAFFDNVASLRGSSFEGPALTASNVLVADLVGSDETSIYIRDSVPGESFVDTALTNVTFARGTVLRNDARVSTTRVVNSVLLGGLAGNAMNIRYSCADGGVRVGDDQGHNLSRCGSAPFLSPFVAPAAGDYRLLVGAAAVGSGLDSAPGLLGIVADLAGKPRFVGTVDMGAYELQ